MTDVYFKLFGDRALPVYDTVVSFTLFDHAIVIRWYGLLIACGFLLAALFGGRLAYKRKINLDHMVDVLVAGTVLGILGARAYYVLFHLDQYDRFADFFKIWEGGLAIYGGLIGGLLGAFLVCRWRRIPFLQFLDIASMSFLIGQCIGRWGNFANQEAFGTNTTLPWGMWSEKTAQYILRAQTLFAEKGITAQAGTLAEKAYVHPTFLYESLWCLLAFLLIFFIYKRWYKFSGICMLCYGILYGAERFLVEGLRLDSLYLWNTNIRVSQLLSTLLVLACTATLITVLCKKRSFPWQKSSTEEPSPPASSAE